MLQVHFADKLSPAFFDFMLEKNKNNFANVLADPLKALCVGFSGI